MYSYSKFLKHILIVGFLDVLSIIQTLIFLPIITKILGAGDYGVWSQLKATMGFLVPFTFLGLHEALIRFLPVEEGKEEIKEGIYSSLCLVLGMNLMVALFLIIFSNYVSDLLKIGPEFVKLLAMTILFESLISIFLVVIRTLKKIACYFWFMAFKMLGETGLVIGAILLGYGLYGSVWSLLLIRIIIFIVLGIYLLKKIGAKVPNFSLVKSYLVFGLPTIADSVSYWAITSIDRYFIGYFWGIVFVGYYAPAYSIGMLLTVFLVPLAFMLSVILPKLFDENKIGEVQDYLSNSLKYYLSIAIPAAFGLSILSKKLLMILSTQEIANAAFLVVPIVTVSILLYGISYFYSQILVLAKKTKIIALVWAIGAFLNIVLNIIFIPKFGIVAAALTTLSSYVCAFLLLQYFAGKEFRFRVEWSFILKSVLASLMMTFFIIWFYPQSLSGLLLLVFIAVIVYVVFIFLFKGFGKKEIIFFKDFFYEMVFPNK